MIKALRLHCRGWRCSSGGSKIPHTPGATKKGGGGQELEDLCSTMTSVETFSLRTQSKNVPFYTLTLTFLLLSS